LPARSNAINAKFRNVASELMPRHVTLIESRNQSILAPFFAARILVLLAALDQTIASIARYLRSAEN